MYQSIYNKASAEAYLYSLNNLPRDEYMQNADDCKNYHARVAFLLQILGNPEKQIPHYIHVTGTSGKGSVCFYLEQVLLADEKKVGLLTSPHMSDIAERWRIDGKNISDDDFVAIVQEVAAALEMYTQTSPYDMVSFFDITTVIALLYFAKNNITHAIMEVGCGGRYDSTNIIPHKDIAIITNIGLDHTHILGNTKEKIAYAKAGIINTNCHVITGIDEKPLREIIDQEAQIHHASVSHISEDTIDIPDNHTFIYDRQTYKLNTEGSHQAYNASLVIRAAIALNIPTHAVQTGLMNTKQPLRFEVIRENPYIIIDGAHNRAKIAATTKTAQKFFAKKPFENRYILVGFSFQTDDDALEEMIASLAKLNPAEIICTRNSVNLFKKISEPKKIADMFKKYLPNTPTQIFLDPLCALTYCEDKLKKDDILLITGSIYLAGQLRPYLIATP